MSDSPTLLFWLLFTCTALQRLGELRHSARNQAAMREAGFLHVDRGLSYAVMVLVHATWFLAMGAEALLYPKAIPSFAWYTALIAFVSAQGLRVWAIRSLGSQWNTQVMNPDTGESDPGIVSSGPYRHIRHPNYLAVIVEFLSLPLLGGALLTVLIWSAFNGAVLAYRIQLEERHLIKRPGYQESVGRLPRLIPSIFNCSGRTAHEG